LKLATHPRQEASRPGVIRGSGPFMGRREERELLDDSLRDATAGHARLLLVAGETGIGKSRLLREWRSKVHAQVRSIYGHCYEDISIPYLPFVELVGSCVDQWGDAYRTLDEGEQAVIRSLLGKEQEPMPRVEPDDAGDYELLRLSAAVSHLLVNVSREQPLVVILDDVHWADRSSLDLLGHVVIAIMDQADRQPLPILILATHRSGEMGEWVKRTIARLKREDACAELALSGLTEVETAELMTGLGYGRPSHQLVATVYDATRGNPLFVREAMHHLADSAALVERGGYLTTAVRGGELKLPAEVSDAIEVRLNDVSRTCREALELASCLGDTISYDVYRAASAIDSEPALSAIDECVAGGWLVSEGASLRFTHPLVRHVVHRRVIGPRRQLLHHRIAQALIGTYAGSLDEHTQEIAHHLVNSGPAPSLADVRTYAKRAADQAAATFAWGEAAKYYEAAILAAASDATTTAAERAELCFLAADAYHHDEDAGPAVHSLELAVEAFREAGDPVGVVRSLTEKVRIGFSFAAIPIGTLVAEVKPLMEAMERLEDEDSEVLARALDAISTAYFHARQSEQAEAVAHQAIEMCHRMGDPGLEAAVSNSLGLAQLQSLRVEEALRTQERSMELAAIGQNRRALCWASTRRALTLMSLGRLGDARDMAREAWELAQRNQAWAEQSLALAYRAAAAFHFGDFPSLQQFTAESLIAARRCHYPWGPLIALPTLANARCLTGAYDEAEDAIKIIDERGELFQEPGMAVRGLAIIYRSLIRATRGDLAGARQMSAAILGPARQMIGRDLHSIPAYCTLGELGARLNDMELLTWCLDALQEAYEMKVVLCSSWGYLIPRAIGAGFAAQRRWAEAERYLDEAIAHAEAAGARTELGRACLDYAQMLAARRGKGDVERGGDYLARATGTFEELGMNGLIDAAQRVGADLELQATPLKRSRTSHPDNLSEREMEVLLLVAQGRSNQRVADELVLSHKTVARHISNIFSKIAVDNRSGATAYAFEKGLMKPAGN